MIDLHTHLLPGVDDGSPNERHSATVLQRMQAEGVTVVVCTPHLNASHAAAAPYRQHIALLEDLRAIAPPAIDLLSGWEIMLDDFGIDLTATELALGNSRARLVEFPRRRLPDGSTAELIRLRAVGVTPVVAHPERYIGCTLDMLDGWRELGAVLQGDALALLGAGPMSEFARSMLAHGLFDVLASDNHGDRRSLSTARLWLQEIGAPEQARLLTEINPRRVLQNEPPLSVAPVLFESGMFDRLKALIFGRKRTASAG